MATMTIDQKLNGIYRAMARCDARSRKDGDVRWSLAIAALLKAGFKALREEEGE